jgi:hypothetical protein
MNIAIVLPFFKEEVERIAMITEEQAFCVQDKIYTKITARRTGRILKPSIFEEQSEFRKGRSCTDSIFFIQKLVQKHKDHNLETHLLF